MSKPRAWLSTLALGVTATLGCDGQQYVSADTVALSITDARGASRLDACRYIPVLLGGRSVSRYPVDGDLQVTLDLSRDEVTVVFESTEQAVEPFRVPSARFDGAAREEAPAPPSGYTVELTSPCAP